MKPSLHLTVLRSFQDYERYRARNADTIVQRERHELELSAPGTPFSVPGYCYLCRMDVTFNVTFEHSFEWQGHLTPNFREQLNCSRCGFNNRMRAAVQILDRLVARTRNGEIYITEQITPMFDLLKERRSRVIGSEYLGTSIPYGSLSERGVRNESISKLTFESGRFAAIVSFDVLEHVPDYSKGFGECFRCLEPGGLLLFSVPFTGLPSTTTRARLGTSGGIEHLLPPEYHGDPLKNEGCLCFYHFGWDMLDQLRAAGFDGAEALFYYSERLGYLGKGEQMIFVARKRSSPLKRLISFASRIWNG